MSSSFKPRHIVAIVGFLAAAAILTPVSVLAATGQLVNLTDPTNAARAAKVNAAGALYVAGRGGAGSVNGATNMRNAGIAPNQPRVLVSTSTAPGVALSELLVSPYGTAGSTARIYLKRYHRVAGTGTCSDLQSGTDGGFSNTTVREFFVPVNETTQLTWGSPALNVQNPTTSGAQPVCFAAVFQGSGIDGVTYGLNYFFWAT